MENRTCRITVNIISEHSERSLLLRSRPANRNSLNTHGYLTPDAISVRMLRVYYRDNWKPEHLSPDSGDSIIILKQFIEISCRPHFRMVPVTKVGDVL